MKETSKLNLPLLKQGQINKDISINTAFLRLDKALNVALEHLRPYNFPPKDLGDELLILTSKNPKEDFENFPHHIVFYKNGWHFIRPSEGQIVWDKESKSHYYYSGTDFIKL